MADLLMADPAFIGNIFVLISIGIGAGILFMILLRMVGAFGGED
jgi:hypothetical protein